MTAKLLLIAYQFITYGLFDILSTLLKPTAHKEKKIIFDISILNENAPDQLRTLVEMYNTINVVFRPVNETKNQGMILIFEFYYFKRYFIKL